LLELFHLSILLAVNLDLLAQLDLMMVLLKLVEHMKELLFEVLVFQH